ncbi:MAG: iron-sulfur cluster assembly accessory protein [Burkholderiales bacterium]|nr:iron-sulfur cluster assembly accessory protein [Burkholderiales bacterium]
MAITLTESAAAQIRSSVARFGGIGLRLGVKKVGCSGLAYTFDMAKEVAPGDHVFEGHAAKLVVPADALPVLDGAELDYVREGFKQMFTVKNPNVKTTCGCGESFGV